MGATMTVELIARLAAGIISTKGMSEDRRDSLR
jgi:hypothetical protein